MIIDTIKDFFLSSQLWLSVVVIVLCVAVWIVLKKCVRRFLKRESIYGKKETNIRFIVTAIKYLIMVLAVIMVLQINGINVTSLVTGLGIAGIIIGFALQDILKDLIMGTNIVWDEFFVVGDVVKYKDIVGKITYFNIKVTKIEDINTGNKFTISNRNISEIEILSDWLDVKVPAQYEQTKGRMDKIMLEICDRAGKIDEVTACEFLGTDEFAESICYYRIRIHCPPEIRNSVRRLTLGIVQTVYEENGLSVPYPHTDVTIKSNND